MKKILFICSGNVGRSQMAEGFYNYYTNSNFASSAGIDPKTPMKYNHPTEIVIQTMIEEKIDVSKQIVKNITKNMIIKSDYIYVLCKKEECPDYLTISPKTIYRDIEDPYKLDINGTRKIRDIIKEKVLSII